MSAADRFRLLGVTTVIVVASTVGLLTPIAASAAAAPAPNPGFSAAFWSPYWFFGRSDAELRSALAAQKAAGSTNVIISWAVDSDAKDAAYPSASKLRLARFDNAVGKLVSADKSLGLSTWMGLVVAPDSWAKSKKFTSAKFRKQQVRLADKVADDLWKRYGKQIAGWYIPIEPSLAMISTPTRAKHLGQFYEAIAKHLHKLSGRKVMVSPSMPYAWSAGVSPETFIAHMAPMVRAAKHVNVWNLQDGFEMTGWSPAQEANAFLKAKALVAKTGAKLWADVYTPATDGNGDVSVAKLVPYLRALAATGVPLSEWLYTDYLAPATAAPADPRTPQHLDDYRSYRAAARPAAATGLTAAREGAAVTVGWTTVEGATAYDVWRQTAAGWTMIGTTTATGIVDQSTTATSYRVMAVSGLGAGSGFVTTRVSPAR